MGGVTAGAAAAGSSVWSAGTGVVSSAWAVGAGASGYVMSLPLECRASVSLVVHQCTNDITWRGFAPLCLSWGWLPLGLTVGFWLGSAHGQDVRRVMSTLTLRIALHSETPSHNGCRQRWRRWGSGRLQRLHHRAPRRPCRRAEPAAALGHPGRRSAVLRGAMSPPCGPAAARGRRKRRACSGGRRWPTVGGVCRPGPLASRGRRPRHQLIRMCSDA